MGWAISLRGGGLIAPAIRDVDKLSIADLMRALKDIVARARSGALRSSELTDATFTITSLGERGVESVGGIIYPPQVAILGLGGIVERPWVVDGTVAPRPLVTASLAADHRASDGHVGSLFLLAFARLMQEPPES
jgi:pyruvate dehydrogenase E2 component (dihydrolipoamide acetyltransferase)